MPNPPKLVLIMEGGLIHEILATAEVEVAIIDYDTEGTNRHHLVSIDSADAYTSFPAVQFEPETTQCLYHTIEQARCRTCRLLIHHPKGCHCEEE